MNLSFNILIKFFLTKDSVLETVMVKVKTLLLKANKNLKFCVTYIAKRDEIKLLQNL